AGADGGNDPGGATHIAELKSRNILALRAEGVRKTWAGPVSPTIVRKEETLFGPSYHFAAIVRVHTNLTDCIVLWELSWRFRINHTEHIFAQHRPSCARIG